jgi:hypothetical protein
MSIGGVSGNNSPWQWNQAHSSGLGGAVTAQAAASSATDGIANTGSVSAGTMGAFFQSFSQDLQAMLAQSGNGATTQTVANQPMAGAHHHHHHHGGGGATQGATSQMTAQMGLDDGAGASPSTATAMQALRAYGAAAANGSAPAGQPNVAG